SLYHPCLAIKSIVFWFASLSVPIAIGSQVFLYEPAPHIMIADTMVDRQIIFLFQNGVKQVPLYLRFLLIHFQRIHYRITAVNNEIYLRMQLLYVLQGFGHTCLRHDTGLYMYIGYVGKPDGLFLLIFCG